MTDEERRRREEELRRQQQQRQNAQNEAKKADQAEAARQAANLRMQKNAMHSEERISDENDNTAHFAPKVIDKKTHQVTSGGQINDNYSSYTDVNEAMKHVSSEDLANAKAEITDILTSSHSSKKYKSYFGDDYTDAQKQFLHSEDTAFLAKDNPADTSLQAAYDSAVKSLKSKKELSMNGEGNAYNLMSWDNPTTQTSMKGAYNPFKDQNGSLEDYYADQYKQAQQNYNYVPNALQNAIASVSPFVNPVTGQKQATDQDVFAATQARMNASPEDQYAYQVANRNSDSTGWQTGNLSDMDKAELQRYQNVVDTASKDKNAKTLNPYETYRYHNLMYGSLTDAQRKAVDNYQTAYDEYQGALSDLKNGASDADAEANYASIGLTSNRKDNATLRANVVSAKQKVEQARNSMRAAGLTDEQINKFVGSDDTDKTYKNSYLGYNRSYKDYLDTQDEAKQVTGRNDAWGLYNRAASSVVSSAVSPITNIGSFINSLGAKSADPGTSKNVYGNKLNNAMDAYRAGNSAYMGKTYGKAGEFLYNAAQSAGDSFVNGMIMGPVANKVSGAVGKALGNGTKAAYVVDKLSNLVGSSAFGAGAYADRIREGQERGQSAAGTQAAAVGAGLAEMVTEAWSLDSFTDILTKKGAAAMRNTLSNILVQAGVEGSEEAAGDIMNRVIDDAANGKNSEYRQAVSAYQKQGMTEKQAKKKANVDFLSDTLQDALAGALSGGVLGGGAHVMNNMQTAQQAQTETAGYTSEDFRNTAESYKKASEGMTDTGAQKYYNDAAKAANDIADRMDSGKKVSSSLYSKLYNSAYEAEGIESENRKPSEEKQEVTPDDQVHFTVPEGAKTVEEALNSGESAQEKVNNMDRIFARKSNNMGAGNVHAAMQSAQTAQELVAAKREADMSTDASARDISEAYYNLYQGRMIQNGQATAEDFQKAESSPTMQEVYQAAKEGHALNISESDPMDLRMAQNAGKQANILLNSNSVLENQDLSNVQIHPATQKSEAYATIDGKDYSLDSLNDTIQNRALRVRVAGASQQSTQELADLYLKDAPQGMSEGRWNTTFSTLEAGGSTGRNFDEAYKAIGGSAAMVDADTARKIYNAGAVAAQAQISENVKRSGQSVARYGTGSVIDSRKNSKEALPYMPVVEAMAKATGVDFYLSDDAPSNINGTFDRAMSRVMINTNNSDAVLNTLFHEGMGEYMQAYNPEGYKSVQKLVSDYLVDTDGLKNVAAIGKKYQRAYQNVEGTKSFYDAMSEAVNDSIAGMFSTDEGIKQFTDWTYKHDKSALQNVADYFKHIGEAFHNFVGRLSGTSQRTARMAEDRANHIRQIILDEMDKAVENSKAVSVDESAKSGVAYSLASNEEQETEEPTEHPSEYSDLRRSLNDIGDDDFFSTMGTEENPDDPDVKHRHELMSEAEKALSDVHVDDKYLKVTAKGIIDSFGSNYDSKTLAENLRKVFSYAKTHEGFMGSSDYEGIMDDVLRPVMEASEQTDDTQLRQVKEIMAQHPFRLTEDQMDMVRDDYRGWKAQYPELKVSKNAPSTLDQQFSEIADQFRQAGIADLDESANETDQLTELLDAIDSAQPVSLYAFSNEEDAQQAVKDMADTVMTSYLSAAEADAQGQALVRIRTARDRIIDEGKARRKKASQDYQARLSAARKDIAKSNRSFKGQGLSNDENVKRLTSAAESLEAQAKELRSQALSSDAKIDRAKLASLNAKEKASADKAALMQRMREQRAAALERQAQQYRQTVARLKTQYHSKAEQLALTKAKNTEKWKNYREKQARNAELEKITKGYDSLYKQLMHPTDEKHIPEEFKSAVAEFLDSINMIRPDIRYDNKSGVYRLRIWDGTFEKDGKAHYTESGYSTYNEAYQAFYRYVFEDNGTLSSKNATIRAKMQGVRDLYEQAAKEDEAENISQLLDPDLYERLKTLSSRNVAALSSDELHTISLALQNIQHAVNSENELFRQSQSPKAIYESIRDHADSVHGRQSHRPGTDKLLDFMSLDNATPETVFHGLGKGGDSVFKEFVKANNMKSRDLRTAQEYMIGDGSTDHGVYKSGALKGVSQKQLQEWSTKSITVHGNIRMTYGQIMGLYELAKRQQAMLHTVGGISIDNFLDEHHRKVTQGRAYLSAPEIQAIVDGNLTTQQKQVADAMQKFMAQECSSWGNEASMLMYGYKKFNEENYYPITVDKKVLSTKNADVAQAAVNAIKNMGMTKAVVPNASNPLVVKDIFDVYTNHVADMATYHSYAAPLADLLRVLNYKEVVEQGGYKNYDTVKDAIAKIYGDGGVRYITNFITDINGRERSNYINPLGWLTSNYKAAAVGWNLRVVRQQPMAVFRAADVISPKYLMEGQILNKDAMEMQDRTSDMTWEKKQGNVDGYIYKSMKQTLTGAATPVEKLRNASMSLAGKADDFTWRRIYNAAYLEQRDKFRKEGKATSGKAFEDAVNDRFDEIIVRTQVTDATILRSQFMRSKDTLNQIQGAFMAEPTKSYNMFLRAAMDAVQQSNGKWVAGKALWGVKKAAAVYLVTQIFTALAQSSVDWIRKDPEDGEDTAEFMLRVYKENFFDDLNPLNLVPILKDASNSIQSLISWVKGEPTYSDDSRMDIASLNTAIKAVENTAKAIMGKGTVYGALYSDIKALSQIIGIPAANLIRDVTAVRNKLNNIQSVHDLIGGDWETTMPSQKEKILDAYKYGELGDLASGIVDSKTTDALAENADDIKDGSIEKAAVEKQAKSEALTTILGSFKKQYQAADDATRKVMRNKLTSQLKSAGFSEEAIDEKLGNWTDVKLKKDANGYKNIDPVTGEKTSVGDVFKTIRTGSGDYKKEIDKAIKAGKTYKQIETDITSAFKAQYLADYQKSPSSVSQLKNRLAAVYKYLDDQEIKEGTQQKETTSRQWLDDPAAYLKSH